MKFGNDRNELNGRNKIVANDVDKKCDNVTVGASFNMDKGSTKIASENNNSDNPYAELEFYLENVKVRPSNSCIFE